MKQLTKEQFEALPHDKVHDVRVHGHPPIGKKPHEWFSRIHVWMHDEGGWRECRYYGKRWITEWRTYVDFNKYPLYQRVHISSVPGEKCSFPETVPCNKLTPENVSTYCIGCGGDGSSCQYKRVADAEELYQERLSQAKNYQWSAEMLEVMEFMQDKSTSHYAEVLCDVVGAMGFIKNTSAERTDAIRDKLLADLTLMRLNMEQAK